MVDMNVIRRERAVKLAEAIEAETGVPASEILGRSRDPEVVEARHRLWRLLRDTGLSYPAIARAVGVDHTSVIYAVRKAHPGRKVRVA